jgi:hypothetical protein
MGVILMSSGIRLLFSHDAGPEIAESDDRSGLARRDLLAHQPRPAMQRLPSDNRVGGAVALNTSPEFLIPVPEITERFGECRLWTKDVFLWLDA